jgi:hypothetical protein
LVYEMVDIAHGGLGDHERRREMAEESRLEAKLVRAARATGGLALKFISPGYDGVPDRVLLIATGHISFVEVKARGKKPRPLQLSRMRRLESLGFRTFVLDDESQIGTIIEETMKGGDGR